MWNALKNIKELTERAIDNAQDFLDNNEVTALKNENESDDHSVVDGVDDSNVSYGENRSHNASNPPMESIVQQSSNVTTDDSWEFDESYDNKKSKQRNSSITPSATKMSSTTNFRSNITSQSTVKNVGRDNELITLRNELSLLKTEKVKLSNVVNELQSELNSVIDEKNALNATVLELQMSNSRLSKQRNNIPQDHDGSTEVADKNQEIVTLTSKNKNLNDEINRLKQEVATLQRQCQNHEQSSNRVTTELQVIITERDDLKNSIASLQEQYNKAQKDLMASINSSTSAMDSHRSSMAALQVENNNLASQLSSALSSIKTMEATMAQHADDTQEWEAQVQQLTAELAQAKSVYVSKEQALTRQLSELKLKNEQLISANSLKDTPIAADDNISSGDTNSEAVSDIATLKEKLNDVKLMRDNLKLDVENTLGLFSTELQEAVVTLGKSVEEKVAIKKLTKQLKDAENTIKTLQEKSSEYQRELQELQQLQASNRQSHEVEAIKNENNTLLAHLETYKTELQRRDEDKAIEDNKHAQIVDKLERNLQHQILENTTIRGTLDTAQGDNNNLKEKIRLITEEMKVYKEASTQSKEQVQGLVEEVNYFKQQLEAKSRDLNTKTEAISKNTAQQKAYLELEANFARVSDELEEAKKRLQVTDDEINKFNEKKKRDLENLKKVNERIAVVQREKNEWEGAANELKSCLEKAENRAIKAESAYNQAQVTIDKLQQELSDLQNDEKKGLNTGNTTEVSVARSDEEESSEDVIAKQEQMIKDLNTQLSHTIQEITALKEQITLLRQEAESANRQANVAEAAKLTIADEMKILKENCRSQLDVSNKRVEALEDERIRLEEELKTLEQFHMQTLASQSNMRVERQLFNDNDHDLEGGMDYAAGTPKKHDAIVLPVWLVLARHHLNQLLPNNIKRRLPSANKLILGYFALVHVLLFLYSSKQC